MEGVISFTKNILNISIQSVILFGLGLGAIPSLYVVSTNKQNAEDIKGIILYSPYLNENLLEAYSEAKNSSEIVKIQNEFLGGK